MIRLKFLIPCLAAMASIVVISSASYAQQKTAKACEEEWKANKAAIQGSGKTKKAFMIECRSGTKQAAPTIAPAPGTARPAQRAERPAAPARRGTTASAAAGQFATAMEAKAHCPGQTVVWANTRSKIYHFAGSRSYGTTKQGAYMCERDTAAAGIRVAKNEKRPQ
ncbi:MAG: hypothetical protein HY765_00110 [Rhodomicrobium sp.]|nr:hypothetical protein [Rhodomicrobium sp.]